MIGWLSAVRCDQYAEQLQQTEGIQELADLSLLLEESDEDISNRLKLFMKAVDLGRFLKALRSDVTLWLQSLDCLAYSDRLADMGFACLDDFFGVKDEPDEQLRAQFAFVGEVKKVHLQRLIKGIKNISIS